MEAADDERRRLERDLHDGAQQRLVALALDAAAGALEDRERPGGRRSCWTRRPRSSAHATDELRELARGIHPAVLTDRGLGAALDALAGRAPLPVELDELPDERLPAPVESAAYFVVVRGAHERRASTRRRRTPRSASSARTARVTVEVRDDGVGGADPARGSGLRGLADRVAALDGRLEVESDAGSGTTVRAEVPCE